MRFLDGKNVGMFPRPREMTKAQCIVEYVGQMADCGWGKMTNQDGRYPVFIRGGSTFKVRNLATYFWEADGRGVVDAESVPFEKSTNRSFYSSSVMRGLQLYSLSVNSLEPFSEYFWFFVGCIYLRPLIEQRLNGDGWFVKVPDQIPKWCNRTHKF